MKPSSTVAALPCTKISVAALQCTKNSKLALLHCEFVGPPPNIDALQCTKSFVLPLTVSAGQQVGALVARWCTTHCWQYRGAAR